MNRKAIEKEFVAFYEETFYEVKRAVRYLVDSDDEVDDIVQKGYLKLLEVWESVSQSKLDYLYITCRNDAYKFNMNRKRKKSTHVSFSIVLDKDLPSYTDTEFEINNFTNEIAKALPENLKVVFAYLYIDDLEIGKVCSLSGYTKDQVRYKKELISKFVKTYTLDQDATVRRLG